MTHDELLAKIGNGTYKEGKDTILDHQSLQLQNKALRAAVELHKPRPAPELLKDFICDHCSWGKGIFEYPCPTIQAIEKELR